jgi:UDP-N-acetylglucosamine--N-acetylmuramyl-(pentapeptide) pyrophosphoryl-undecaprenol N-acetylglucosamine transferase
MGGSLGATVLNETVPRALALIHENERPHIVHQTGERHLESVRAAYAEQGLTANVLPFIDDMASAYANADLVIGRAGAMTVSELCAAGVASILVPLRISTTAHQTHNAEWLAQQGACLHLPQAELTPARLAELLCSLDRTRLLQMAECARQQAKPQATTAIADLIEAVSS